MFRCEDTYAARVNIWCQPFNNRTRKPVVLVGFVIASSSTNSMFVACLLSANSMFAACLSSANSMFAACLSSANSMFAACAIKHV